ncbi:SDR family NAD(P)-dependent oxidoreductase [Chryseolinea soli]|uniref:SDR family oxidoreductase n=1 Tax=Chryseolinea soli TaxID=2321403 RepID=A0A385SZD4_9BACT|nr:SDR family NAD(P)-dependent oxidoreductase [Chryseolinea soli]AYB34118.1 SDR family oxidoreductase [Chryseolinea soli]
MFDLSDKVVLITGAGQNVGSGIARILAKHGATIIASDVNKKKADRVCEAVFRAGGIGISTAFDITDHDAVTTSLREVTEKTGDIDILINNAGTVGPQELSAMTSFSSIREDHWSKVIEVNLSGFLNCCQAVLGPMSSKQWGRIITVASSLTGFETGGSLYAAGKSGAIGFVGQLAKETFTSGITCNAISLEWKQQQVSGHVPYLNDRSPVPRIGTPDDVGYLSLYLSTEAASWISGRTIPLEIVY